MKKMLLTILAVLFLSACNTQPQLDVSGTWEGSMNAAGAIPIKWELNDQGGAISGTFRFYDSTYGWRIFGAINGTHNTSGDATLTSYATDGSGHIEFEGTFNASSFSGYAYLYNASGDMTSSATVSLAK